MPSLAGWDKNNILKITIDNKYITETISNFPLLVNISEDSGLTSFNCNEFFEKMAPTIYDDVSSYSLILNADSSDGLLMDTSGKNHTVVFSNSNSCITTSESMLGNSCIKLDLGYLSVSPEDDLIFGNSDFTVHAWVLIKSYNGYNIVGFMDFGSRSSGVWVAFSTGVIYHGVGGLDWSNSWTAPPNNQWFHIACVKYGSTCKVYINGINVCPNNTGFVYPATDTTNIFTFGRYTNGSTTFDGYMNEIIVIKGVALWTSNFTPPSSKVNPPVVPYKKIVFVYPDKQEHLVTAFSEETKLLISSGDRENNSTFFEDTSRYGHSLTIRAGTFNSNVGPVFGSSSIYINGTTGGFSVPESSDWSFGMGNFTIELWCKFNAKGINILLQAYVSVTGWSLYYWNENIIWYTNSSIWLQTNFTFNLNTWYHIAVTRSDATLRIFVNGVENNSRADTFTYNPDTSLDIGWQSTTNNYFWSGYMDEIRIVKGQALYTSNFTPATTRFTKPTNLISYDHGSSEQLYCEISSWDYVNKSVQLWVKIPRIAKDQPTDIFMYYDKTQEDNTETIGWRRSSIAQQVWTENYALVYHLNNATVANFASTWDSTSNNNHGISPVYMNTSLGAIGKACYFAGSTSSYKISVLNNTSLNITPEITLEVLFNRDITASSNTPLIHKNNFGEQSIYGLEQYGYYGVFRINTSDTVNAGKLVGGSFYNGTWEYMAGSYNTGEQKLIQGNNKVASYSYYSTALMTNNEALTIGCGYSYMVFKGLIQEIRISNKARSTVWLFLSNNSYRDALVTISKYRSYRISGYIEDSGLPAQRVLCIYKRSSGELVAKTISGTDGFYTAYLETNEKHNIICQDDDTGLDLNDLILSKITPVELM
jgi:hypothetical protein